MLSCTKREMICLGLTYLVRGEGNMGSLEETTADHVAQGVIFLVEGEDRGGGQT